MTQPDPNEKLLPEHGTPDKPVATNAPAVAKKEPVKDDAYAQALLKVTTAEFNERQANKPEQKHFISRKMIILLVISLIFTVVVSILVSVFGHHARSNNSNSSGNQDTTQQTIQGIQNVNNPSAY